MKMLFLTLSGAILMFLGIVLGALGSHALSDKLTPSSLVSFMTGVRYMMYHALVLLFISQLPYVDEGAQSITGTILLIGTLLFSGSIFLLSTQSLHGTSMSFLGPITPIGGLVLMIGWAYLIVKYAALLLR